MAAASAEPCEAAPTLIARIGLDLDNTIIDYRRVFQQTACEMGLCPPEFSADKTRLRDMIRTRPDGERLWTELQAQVYGPRLMQATPAPGALAFVQRCVATGIPTFIVSHKSRYAAADPAGVDLHTAARRWLVHHGFVGRRTLPEDAVFFEPTRNAKLVRIARLGCTSFVDDLREVFDDPAFPPSVERLLLGCVADVPGRFSVVPDWYSLAAHLLGRADC